MTETAWSELSSDLFRFIRPRVRDDELAADLVQEVFVRIHQGLGDLTDEEKLFAWVYRIARNTISDHYRKRPGPETLAHEPEVGSEVDDDLNSEVGTCLRSMLKTLPESYREAVELSEVGGLTQKAVGERLGLSLSGAKSRIQRGRDLLRQYLLACCHVDFDRRGNVTDFVERKAGCENCGTDSC